jgi:hypothetical protein
VVLRNDATRLQVYPRYPIQGGWQPEIGWQTKCQETTLTKHDHVIEQFSTKGADPPLRVAVLPRGLRRGAELFDTKISDSRVEGPAVDRVAVENQTDHVGIGADRLDDLLGGPTRRTRAPSR